jgi:hypothetical protein
MKTWRLSILLCLLAPAVVAQTAPAKPGQPPDQTQQEKTNQDIQDALQRGAEVSFQGQLHQLGVNPLDLPTFRNLYNEDSVNGCREGSTGSVGWQLCYVINNIPIFSPRGDYNYWEPAAIVEVSCQKGYSLLKPGLLGVGAKQGEQPVQPGQCGTGPNWFFEVRVWASSPKKWGDRATILGNKFWAQFGGETCSGMGTTGNGSYPWGYGKKYGFTKGPETGPANSYEAYISDLDPTWSQQLTPGQAAQQMALAEKAPENLSPCQYNRPNRPDYRRVQSCWGPTQPNGWVTHPNRAVAAALAGYRGLLKAQNMNRVASPINSGWRLSMDYPFVKSPATYAQNMGMTSQGRTRHRGSDCFVPGDPGPWWFSTGRRGQNPPALQLGGATATTANADTGVYIFTYWVRTKCTVYSWFHGGACNDQYDY